MGEWKEYKLREVIDKFIDYRGKTPPKTESGIPLITAKIVKDGRILEPTEFIAEEYYEQWMTRGYPEINDVVLTTEAPLGEVALLKNKKVALAQRIITLRGKKDLCYNAFLKYYFQSNVGQASLLSRAQGSTVEGIKSAELKEVEVHLPPLPEQKSIAAILSSLDDKIDLLHRQNKTLEALAETLFRQWFVEETEEGWETGKLGDYADVTTGKGLKRHEFDDNGIYPVLGANGEIGRTNNFLTDDRLILTGRVGTLGKVYISEDKVWISDNVLIVKPESIFFYPIYFILKRTEFENLNVGSTQPLVTQTDLKSIEFKLPSADILRSYEKQCSTFFEKISKNKVQIRTLTRLRDTLLPKLMSGEVRVEN